MTKHWRTE